MEAGTEHPSSSPHNSTGSRQDQRQLPSPPSHPPSRGPRPGHSGSDELGVGGRAGVVAPSTLVDGRFLSQQRSRQHLPPCRAKPYTMGRRPKASPSPHTHTPPAACAAALPASPVPGAEEKEGGGGASGGTHGDCARSHLVFRPPRRPVRVTESARERTPVAFYTTPAQTRTWAREKEKLYPCAVPPPPPTDYPALCACVSPTSFPPPPHLYSAGESLHNTHEQVLDPEAIGYRAFLGTLDRKGQKVFLPVFDQAGQGL